MSSNPTRIACVGGSITHGLGLENRRAECYPAILQTLLGEAYEVRNCGYSGASVSRQANEPYWRTPSFTAATRFDPQIVLLALGTNDAQVANLGVIDEFQAEYRALVDYFQSLSTKPALLLVSPPPVFDPLPEIDIRVLDEVIRPTISRIAADMNLPLVDAYTPFVDRQDLFPDNLHPNAAGARMLAELAAEVVRAVAPAR